MKARVLTKTQAVIAVGVLATGSIFAAAEMTIPDYGIDNPGSLQLTETRSGVQNVLATLQKNQAAQPSTQAGSASSRQPSNTWFRLPSVYSEYTYTDSRDRSLRGSWISHMRNVTAGVNFLTVGDVAVNFEATYEHTAAAERYVSGNDNLGDLSLTLAKNIDWALVGVSVSHSEGYGRDNEFGNPFVQKTLNTTVAPFVGAMYSVGDLRMATIPTYVFNWEWSDYDSTLDTSANDHLSQQTFVWVNTVDYTFFKKLTVGVEADWNRVTNIKKSYADPYLSPGVPHRAWINVGPKVSYAVTSSLSVYGEVDKALYSGTFDVIQATVGASYSF